MIGISDHVVITQELDAVTQRCPLSALPGRGRYERRGAVDAATGHRYGFGKPRRLSLSSGTITARRKSGGCCQSCTCTASAEGDFDLALRGLLSDGRRCRRPRSPG